MAAPPDLKPTTRGLLMKAGRDIVLAQGFQALTVRAVAAAANANLGSFVYHFGTRDAFVTRLIEEWYAPLLSRMTGNVDASAAPIERLRQAILQLVDFSIEHDAFVGRIFAAALAGDRCACEFLGSLSGRHPKLLLELIATAQATGDLVDADPLQVACFLMASVGLPRLLASGWQGPAPFAKPLSAALSHIARDRNCIVQRLDWAFHGLSPREHR